MQINSKNKLPNNAIAKWPKGLNTHFFKEDIWKGNKYVKGWSSPLVAREMQIKTTCPLEWLWSKKTWDNKHWPIYDPASLIAQLIKNPPSIQETLVRFLDLESFTISQSLLKLTSIESVMLCNRLVLCRPFLLLPSIFPASKYFLISWLFASGGPSIRVSASAAVLPMNIQDWFPLVLTGLISLQS